MPEDHQIVDHNVLPSLYAECVPIPPFREVVIKIDANKEMQEEMFELCRNEINPSMPNDFN